MEKTERTKERKIYNLDDWLVSKQDLAVKWIENSTDEKRRRINKGEIYLCELGENIGHEQCKTRPVIVLSSTRTNNNGQVVVAPLTSSIKTKNNSNKIPRYQTHYILFKEKYKFLERTSAVMTEQVRSISTIRLTRYIGTITKDDELKVNARIKRLFDI